MAALDEELAALQRALGGDQQLVRVDRLHEEGVRAELQALDSVRERCVAAHDDDGRVRIFLAHLTEKLDPGYARVEDVGHDERRSPDLEDLQSLSAVADESARVARRPENLAQEVARSSVVVDNQDVALGHVNLLSERARQRNTRGSDFSET